MQDHLPNQFMCIVCVINKVFRLVKWVHQIITVVLKTAWNYLCRKLLSEHTGNMLSVQRKTKKKKKKRQGILVLIDVMCFAFF